MNEKDVGSDFDDFLREEGLLGGGRGGGRQAGAQLVARLLYGSGLRLSECLRLRIKDADFSFHQLTVRDGKGGRTG